MGRKSRLKRERREKEATNLKKLFEVWYEKGGEVVVIKDAENINNLKPYQLDCIKPCLVKCSTNMRRYAEKIQKNNMPECNYDDITRGRRCILTFYYSKSLDAMRWSYDNIDNYNFMMIFSKFICNLADEFPEPMMCEHGYRVVEPYEEDGEIIDGDRAWGGSPEFIEMIKGMYKDQGRGRNL